MWLHLQLNVAFRLEKMTFETKTSPEHLRVYCSALSISKAVVRFYFSKLWLIFGMCVKGKRPPFAPEQ